MNNITLQPEPTLSVLAEGYAPKGHIAEQVLPGVKSDTITGYFGRFAGEYLNIVDTITKGNGQKNVVTYTVDRNKNYEVLDHELENEVTAAEAERFGGWDFAKKKINTMLSFQMKQNEEYVVSNYLTDETNITNYDAIAAGDRLDVETSDVLGLVKTAKDSVASKTGMEANSCVIGRNVFAALQIHPTLYSVLGGAYKGEFGLLSEQQMAVALGIEKVLVGRAIYNSENEGQTVSLSYLWGNNMLVYYAAEDDMADVDPGLGARLTCPAKIPVAFVGSYVPEGKRPEAVQMLKQSRGYSYSFVNTDAAYLYQTAV